MLVRLRLLDEKEIETKMTEAKMYMEKAVEILREITTFDAVANTEKEG